MLLDSVIERFSSVSLAEIEQAKLLSRSDRKYVINAGDLPGILNDVVDDYRILQVKSGRNRAYQTLYFDSSDHMLYKMHHNGKANRFKLRIRTYLDTGQTFYELKRKNQKYRTIKTRVLSTDKFSDHHDLVEPFTSFCPAELGRIGQIHLTLKVLFNRITLVHNSQSERVTIDTGLVMSSGDTESEMHDMCIIEVKVPNDKTSPFGRLLHQHKVLPLRVSKYCLGMIASYPDLKMNNFKPRILRMKRVLDANSFSKNFINTIP